MEQAEGMAKSKYGDNAFEGLKLTTSKWLHRIPAKDSDWIAPCF